MNHTKYNIMIIGILIIWKSMIIWNKLCQRTYCYTSKTAFAFVKYYTIKLPRRLRLDWLVLVVWILNTFQCRFLLYKIGQLYDVYIFAIFMFCFVCLCVHVYMSLCLYNVAAYTIVYGKTINTRRIVDDYIHSKA